MHEHDQPPENPKDKEVFGCRCGYIAVYVAKPFFEWVQTSQT